MKSFIRLLLSASLAFADSQSYIATFTSAGQFCYVISNTTPTTTTTSTSPTTTTTTTSSFNFNGCSDDACARDVLSTSSGQSPTQQADCSSFLSITVYPATVTTTSTVTVSNAVSDTTIDSTEIDSTTVYVATETDTVTVETDTATVITGTITILERDIPTATATATTVSPTSVPASVACNPAEFTSACSCAGVTPTTVTMTTPTVTASTTVTVTMTAIIDATETDVVTISETSTVAADVTATVTDDTAAQVTQTGTAYCENGQAVNGLATSCTTNCNTFNLRIEGASDTVYEGQIRTGPKYVTTPSGGTHLCDGTNDGANPAPAGNGISAIADAATLCGFDFDGTFSSQFDDFFITRIGSSAETSNEYWGILIDFAFTPSGGCETEPENGDDLLWAFNAFNANYFLDISPRTASVAVGTAVTFTVTGHDGNGDSGTPIAGATFNGATTDSSGHVAFVATVPGTYRLKATRSDSIRSPAAIITVTA